MLAHRSVDVRAKASLAEVSMNKNKAAGKNITLVDRELECQGCIGRMELQQEKTDVDSRLRPLTLETNLAGRRICDPAVIEEGKMLGRSLLNCTYGAITTHYLEVLIRQVRNGRARGFELPDIVKDEITAPCRL